MAQEEVDEAESGEEEEEAEEEERPKKKRKRAFAERPRGRARRAHGSLAEPRLYSKGVPIGPNGTALEDVPMRIEDVERIGAFDEESARITENSRRVLSRKASGEADVKFNSDSRTKYFDIRKYYPGAIIAITQVYPVKNEALRPTSFAACPNYDALLGYVRDHYWKGDDAAYVWRAYTETKSALGIGRFEFAADPDWEPGGRREPQQHQQAPQQAPQQNPFGQFGMPGVMMPGVGGMPPIFMPQQSQPQQTQQTHQPNPVAAPAGDPMAVIGPLLNYLLPLISNQAAQSAYLQNLPQVIEQKVKEATPPPAPPVPAAAPPPTPVEQMEQAANIISTVNRTGRQIATSLGFQANPNQVNNEPPPPGSDDDFPWQIRRVGPVNVAAQDGKVVDNMFLQGAVNAGPVLGLVDSFFKRLSDSKKEAAEIELRTLEAKRQWEEQRLKNIERAVQLQGGGQVPQPQPEPEPWKPPVPPPWSVERKPPPPEPDPTS